MTVVFYLAVLLVSLLAAALVAAPLRRSSPRAWLTVLVLVTLLPLGLYQMLGTPAAMDPAARVASVASASDGDPHADPADFAEAVSALRAELDADPRQPQGWSLLARSLAMQGDYAGTRDAYARALELLPDDPGLMVELAQASAQAHPQNLFEDQALALLERAAALQPANQRARWFIGVAQRQRGMDAEAIATWEALLPEVDPSTAASLRNQIADARGAPAVVPSDAGAGTDAASPGSGLRVRISLAPGVAERLGGRGTVFVMARAPDGPPMPVAAERHDVSALPLEILLDDADSPMPTQVLSQLQQALVSARISASGSVERSADDVESAQVRVSLPTEAIVELVIGAE